MATTDKTKNWAVKLFQLNPVANEKGESGIVILLDQSDKQRPKIKRCVLIDGGNGSKISQLIVDTMDRIGPMYGGVRATFDAVVISHWDNVSTFVPVFWVSQPTDIYRTILSS